MKLHLVVLLLLAGCAGAPPLTSSAPPIPVVLTEKCVTVADIPVLPPTNAVPNGTHRQNAAATAADADQARAVAGEAIAILSRCAQ